MVALPAEPIRVPPTPALRRWSAEHGFSPELVARWGEFYPDLPGLLKAMVAEPKTWLRYNSLRGDPADTARRLRGRGVEIEPGPLPSSARVLASPFSVGATPEYLLGRYFLQDLSSQLAPLALDPRPGERIADLSAAPGGKTVAVADLMHDDGLIASFEISPERHKALASNLARCGVTSCATWALAGERVRDLGMEFDAVLLDAPCTGEGVTARDPRRRTGQLREYAECARQQRSLLEAAAAVLRPGGRLVYATCTLAPEENELQVAHAASTLGLAIEDLPPAVREARLNGAALLPGLARAGPHELPAEIRRTAHALPHLHGCLGFFVARLRKEAP